MFVQTVVVVSDMIYIPVQIPLSEIMEEMETTVPIMRFERMNRWKHETKQPS